MWQDTAIMIGGFVLAISLIPSVKSKHKPHIKTSLITGGILTLFTVAYYTMGYFRAVAGTAASTALWYILAYQAYLAIRRSQVKI